MILQVLSFCSMMLFDKNIRLSDNIVHIFITKESLKSDNIFLHTVSCTIDVKKPLKNALF